MFKTYLEYLTRKERSIAADNGQTNLIQINKVTAREDDKLPEWWHSNFYPTPEHVTTKKEYIDYYSDKISEVTPNTDYKKIRKRVIVVPQGKAYCADSNEVIHNPIIGYMMCLGLIPMTIDLSDYQWTYEPVEAKNLLALEIAAHGSYQSEIYFSESYDPYTLKDVKKIINRHYNEVLKKLFNITTEDIQLMDHHLEKLKNDDEE